MSRQIKGILYYLTAQTKHSFTIFWIILLGTTLGTLAIAGFLSPSDSRMAMSFSAAVYIYAMFFGFNAAKGFLPFVIKLGAIRKNIFIGFGIFFLGLSLMKAFMVSVLHIVIGKITDLLHIASFTSIHPAEFLLADKWLERMIFDTSLLLFLFVLLFGAGLIYYKFGLFGGSSVAGILVILLLLSLATGTMADFLTETYETLSIATFYKLLAAGVAIYFLTWLLLRRITVMTVR